LLRGLGHGVKERHVLQEELKESGKVKKGGANGPWASNAVTKAKGGGWER